MPVVRRDGTLNPAVLKQLSSGSLLGELWEIKGGETGWVHDSSMGQWECGREEGEEKKLSLKWRRRGRS